MSPPERDLRESMEELRSKIAESIHSTKELALSIREQLGTELALIRQTLQNQAGEIIKIVDLVRGEGNGEHGIAARLMGLKMGFQALQSRIAEVELQLATDTSRMHELAVIKAKGRWALLARAVGSIAGVLGGLAGILALILK